MAARRVKRRAVSSLSPRRDEIRELSVPSVKLRGEQTRLALRPAISSARSSRRTSLAGNYREVRRRAFRRSRTATCTSATPSRSASTSACRSSTAAAATCASTTPTRRRKSRSTSTRSRRRCAGSASTGGRTSYFASDYFDKLYRVRRGADRARPRLRRLAERRRDARGARHAHRARQGFALTATRSADESLRLLREMRDGKHHGRHARAAREDRHALAEHQPARPGDVPHPPRAPPSHRRQVVHLPDVRLGARPSDCIEGITHSLCTLEFEDHRPLYDWFNERVAEAGFCRAAAAQADRVRAAQPHLRRAEQAEAASSSSRRSTSTAGTIRACRRSPARAAAATRRRASACSPSASACRKRTR